MKMKSNTGVQLGHLSPFIYFSDQIVPANICLCPPHSLLPVTDGGKSLANGDAITLQPVRVEGENARGKKGVIFFCTTVEGWRVGDTE